MIYERPRPSDPDPDGHGKFKELCALAFTGTLTASERLELRNHLRRCGCCRAIHQQYRLLSTVGMPFLAATYGQPQEQDWNDSEVREALLARVREPERAEQPIVDTSYPRHVLPHFWGFLARPWMAGVFATCLLIAVAAIAYHLGSKARLPRTEASLSLQEASKLAAEKKSVEDVAAARAAKIAVFEEQSARTQQEMNRMRAGLHELEEQSRRQFAASTKSEEQLSQVSRQRDALTLQLHEAEQSYQKLQADLVALRIEHEQAVAQTAALQSRIGELTAANHELEQKIADDERFLASDRDIRELMGARKLYIADVFDVDSGSRERKPFGRVFYTQNKSLIFYAFDLDRQPGVKSASSFQVWGQKDSELNEKRAMNLGILYMDNESSRRWVLRLDDPKEVAEIDAVFVTVEPHGGSPKPTGKPLLYALLRKEANHP